MRIYGKKALSLLLTLMMVFSLSIGFTGAAAEDAPVLTVYTQLGESATPVAAKTYTAAQLAALAETGLAGYQFYKGDAWQVVAATEYVTIDALLSDAGVEFAAGSSLTAAATDGFSSEATYETLQTSKYYFTDADTPVEVPAALALSWSAGSLAEGTLEEIAAGAANTDSIRLVYGTTAELYNDTAAAGKRLVSDVVSITVTQPVTFTDVPVGAWFETYVTELAGKGIITGNGDGTFSPDGTTTYGQALKLIMLATGYPVQEPTGSHWSSGYLTAALADGLLTDSADLDAAISRLEIAQIAAKAMKLTATLTESPFGDTSDPGVLALYEAGIVQGSGGNYNPDAFITRAEISAIIWRINNK